MTELHRHMAASGPSEDRDPTRWWKDEGKLKLCAELGPLRTAYFYELEKRIIGTYRFNRPFIELNANARMGCLAIWGRSRNYAAVRFLAKVPDHEPQSIHRLELRLEVNISASDAHLQRDLLSILNPYRQERGVRGRTKGESNGPIPLDSEYSNEGNPQPLDKIAKAIQCFSEIKRDNYFIPESEIALFAEFNLSASDAQLKKEFVAIVRSKQTELGITPERGNEKGLNYREPTWHHIELFETLARGEKLLDDQRSLISRAANEYLKKTWGALTDVQRKIAIEDGWPNLLNTAFAQPTCIRWDKMPEKKKRAK